MNELQYKFEVFEGPLDLLLHLLEKNKIDIKDIPIALLLEQYLEYVDEYKSYDLETLADFISMASTLIFIKSKMLLPKEEEEEDPRASLVDMLLEYKKYKAAAEELAVQYEKSSGYLKRMPMFFEADPTYKRTHDVEELTQAYNMVFQKNMRRMPPPVESFSPFVTTKVVSVASRVTGVLRNLLKRGKVHFSSLFIGAKSRSEIVATFLAVLELSKTNRIHIGDAKEGEEIPITLQRGEK